MASLITSILFQIPKEQRQICRLCGGDSTSGKVVVLCRRAAQPAPAARRPAAPEEARGEHPTPQGPLRDPRAPEEARGEHPTPQGPLRD